jgi:hypothetical protein
MTDDTDDLITDDLEYDQNGIPRMDARRNRGNINQRVDNRRTHNEALPWVVLASLLGAGGLAMAVSESQRIGEVNERVEQRMRDTDAKASRAEERADLLQYYVIEYDAKLIDARILKPEDSLSAKMRKAAESKQKR